MSAIGVPMEGRGSRSDEYLAAMRSLWQDEAPAYSGRYVDFAGVDAHPRPVQRPIPVVVGGHTTAAHRRTVRHADGWYGFFIDRERTRTQLESLRREADAAGRDFDELEITVSPSERLDPDVVREFGEMGVQRLVLIPPGHLSAADMPTYVRNHAPEALGAEPA